MTSVLNFNINSSSDLTDIATVSKAKLPTTLLIQPPSSNNDSNLLSKRFKTSHLGDLLMKKVKSQTAISSEANSIQQSPTGKSLADAIYDTDNQSNVEDEIESPTISNFDTTQSILMPQRTLSSFSLKLNRANSQSSHKQTLNALETLQKKIVEYQVLNLRDAILKAQLLQGPLVIPSLNSQDSTTTSSKKMDIEKKQIVADDDEDEPEIFYGEVEYPLLHLAPKGLQVLEENKQAKPVSSTKVKASKGKKARKVSNCSSPSYEDSKQNDSLLESLTATRAGTQRSEPEMTVNLKELSEQIAEVMGKRSKKANKKSEENVKSKEAVHKSKKSQKTEKTQEKEKKQKGKKEAKESLLSPMSKSKSGAERRRNRWQLQEENDAKLQPVF